MNRVMESIFTNLKEGAIVSGFECKNKSQLIAAISRIAAEQYDLDENKLLEGLDLREKLGSTGFGGGTAIPHCKYDGLSAPIAVFVQLAKPIDYDAVDENQVDLVFALISPADDGAAHLRALAEASRMLRDQNIGARLRGASDSAALYSLLALKDARDAA